MAAKDGHLQTQVCNKFGSIVQNVQSVMFHSHLPRLQYASRQCLPYNVKSFLCWCRLKLWWLFRIMRADFYINTNCYIYDSSLQVTLWCCSPATDNHVCADRGSGSWQFGRNHSSIQGEWSVYFYDCHVEKLSSCSVSQISIHPVDLFDHPDLLSCFIYPGQTRGSRNAPTLNKKI
jgi:hypothetical protein